LVGLLFHPEDRGDMFHRYLSALILDYRVLHPRRAKFFNRVHWENLYMETLLRWKSKVMKHQEEEEREKAEEKVGGEGSKKHILRGGEKHFLGLKVPRQCPLVLLVEVCLRGGNALGSE
jgi:hypothetical protein